MSYQEKIAWANLVITVVALVTYLTIVLGQTGDGPLIAVSYQAPLLLTIGGAILVAIVASIAIAVTSGGEAGKTDQRDREIDRFSSHVGQAFLVIGALVAFLMALAEWDWFWIAHAIWLGFTLSAILECVARIVAYRRGFQRW